jgi:hypothetical protein
VDILLDRTIENRPFRAKFEKHNMAEHRTPSRLFNPCAVFAIYAACGERGSKQEYGGSVINPEHQHEEAAGGIIKIGDLTVANVESDQMLALCKQ